MELERCSQLPSDSLLSWNLVVIFQLNTAPICKMNGWMTVAS